MSDDTLLERFPMLYGPSIDWRTAKEIYVIYSCLHGTNQSLDRLAERGGFSWGEVEMMLQKHKEQVSRGRCTCAK